MPDVQVQMNLNTNATRKLGQLARCVTKSGVTVQPTHRRKYVCNQPSLDASSDITPIGFVEMDGKEREAFKVGVNEGAGTFRLFLTMRNQEAQRGRDVPPKKIM